MKIAYVTKDDPRDLHAWSGTTAHIFHALEKQGHEMIAVGNLKNRYKIPLKLIQLLVAKTTGKRFLGEREPIVLNQMARQIEKRLSGLDHDIVFCPGTLPIAALKSSKPIVFWTDASFAGILGYYQEFENLSSRTIRNGHQAEQQAISNASLAIYTSEWAAQSAADRYDVDSEKLKVVPLGANIECNRTEADIQQLIESKTFDVCKLLFVGVDWERKGGAIALDVVTQLNKKGICAELDIVGCEPPSDVPEYVKLHGFVSKKSEAGKQLLDRLFSEAHFLIVPSRVECFGLVFCEASSYGLPSLTTNTGGIPTVVREGKNGFTFSLNAGADAYCECVLKYIKQPEDYRLLMQSSFVEYQKRLNWDMATESVTYLVRNMV